MSPTVVSPSPGTVCSSVPNAASIREVLPVPGGPYSSTGTSALRRSRSTSTSVRLARRRGWYSCPFGRRTGPVVTFGRVGAAGTGVGGVVGAGGVTGRGAGGWGAGGASGGTGGGAGVGRGAAH